MQMFPLIAIFSLASAFGVAGQSTQTPKAKAKILTSRGMPPSSVPVRHETIELTHIPESMIRFQKPAGWTVKRAPGTGNVIGPAPNLYAEFSGVTVPGHECREYGVGATIDLRPIRANGFHLVEAIREKVPVPAGYQSEMGGWARDNNGPPALAQDYNITTPLFAKSMGLDHRRFPRPCWGGLSVRLRINGPAGIDPLTGRPYPPRRPVN